MLMGPGEHAHLETWESFITSQKIQQEGVASTCQWDPDPGGNLCFPLFTRFPVKMIGIKKDLESLLIEMAGLSGSKTQDFSSLFHGHVLSKYF